ncbi:unnamed protein product [Gongylonema pulchrum]|uniref:Laminin G domain-containing protein n=1 Tax=Gongylonema pulchrum TaxID=637853 RepID=A0A3P6SZ76_9BILA|nr:unnamed protein product [Gongylonema pulchrum]
MRILFSRTAVVPLSGCIEHLRLDKQLVDLSKSKTAKGVQPGCNVRNVRLITMVSERSTAVFHGISANKGDLELTLRFKTTRPSGVLASVISDEQEALLQLRYEYGFIVTEYGSDRKDVVKIEFGLASDGQWHYVAAAVKSHILRLDVDDLYSSEIRRTVPLNEVSVVQ